MAPGTGPQTMQHLRPGRLIVLGTALLLVVVVTSGCARRGQAGTGSGGTGADVTAPSPLPAASVLVSTVAPSASLEATLAAAGTTPVPTPDLTAIEALIKDIDNDLGADASAAADEGSTP
jgi:hypothetical protein